MDEVAYQEEVVAVLKKSLEGADVSAYAGPCLLYRRAPGLCLSREELQYCMLCA